MKQLNDEYHIKKKLVQQNLNINSKITETLKVEALYTEFGEKCTP